MSVALLILKSALSNLLLHSKRQSRQLDLHRRSVSPLSALASLAANRSCNSWNTVTEVAILNSDPGTSSTANGMLSMYIGGSDEPVFTRSNVSFRRAQHVWELTGD